MAGGPVNEEAARHCELGALPPSPRDFAALPPEWLCKGRRRWPISRHSGRWVGAQVASLRCLILRPGIPMVDDNSLAVQ